MSLLQISQLCKSYGGLVAVDGLTLSINAGEVFGLLGPNGAGKTTTMQMIAGLLRPDSGSIQLAGEDFDPRSLKLRSLLGVVPQDLAIYPDLSAIENLKFFGGLYGLSGTHLRNRIDIVLQHAGLHGLADRLAGTYSGGMKRRLNFAAALLHEPRLLILDEPTVGVDPQSRAHLIACVQQLSRDGMAVIYASHYMDEVQSVCQRAAVIDRGKLLACGTMHELLDRVNCSARIHAQRVSPQLIERLKTEAEFAATQCVASSEQPSDESLLTIILEGVDSTSPPLSSRMIQVLQLLEECGAELASIETDEPDLERLFLELTGHGLRD